MEELTRQLMEYITGKPFDKVRPKWLLSPKGNPMELDGFNVELQLAFGGKKPFRADLIKGLPCDVFHKLSGEFFHSPDSLASPTPRAIPDIG
jgi:hypothetical protein